MILPCVRKGGSLSREVMTGIRVEYSLRCVYLLILMSRSKRCNLGPKVKCFVLLGY
jgi:hypothetical protein